MAFEPVDIIEGIAAVLFEDNIDTDQIIPSREMKSVSKTGLAEGLFAGRRYLEARTPNPDFVLNKDGFKKATILLSGKNFGCGSSREHAVWALKEFGFRAVVAESFGEIFFNNCVRNGILPITLDKKSIADLPSNIQIDLQAQLINGGGFEIANSDKHMLVGGLDPIALTLENQAKIDQFIESDRQARPWVY